MSDEKKELTEPKSKMPSELNLGSSTKIDLSWLPEDERKELLKDYAKGVIEINHKAHQLGVDEESLRSTLENLNNTTRDATDLGAHVTMSHTQSSSIGRTEVIMGNTKQAERGKLSKSQTGETNWTPFYIIATIAAVVIIIALMAQQ